jgi:predicted RecB family nuclease
MLADENRRFLGKLYSFNGTEAAKLAFQVGFFDIVAKSCDKKSSVRVAASLRVLLGVDWEQISTLAR